VNTQPATHRSGRVSPIFGPEPWRAHQGIIWSHWDRWACVVAVVDHDGDLAGLEAHLVDQLRTLDGRDATEAKLSHLTDVRARHTYWLRCRTASPRLTPATPSGRPGSTPCPLLSHLDATGVTRRRGERRIAGPRRSLHRTSPRERTTLGGDLCHL
jgi:hypothetical protein